VDGTAGCSTVGIVGVGGTVVELELVLWLLLQGR
jgi:hypothetical protein